MKKLTIKKPWGQFEQFTHNETTTVKIIFVNKKEAFSLQYHNNRTEFWHILLGHPIVIIGEKTLLANPGDEFIIKNNQLHRLEAQNDDVQVLEITYGDFDEDDIIRTEDKYGRA